MRKIKISFQYSLFTVSEENLKDRFRYIYFATKQIKQFYASNVNRSANYEYFMVFHIDAISYTYLMKLLKQENIDLDEHVVFRRHYHRSDIGGATWRFAAFTDLDFDVNMTCELDGSGISDVEGPFCSMFEDFMILSRFMQLKYKDYVALAQIYNDIGQPRHFGAYTNIIKPAMISAPAAQKINSILNSARPVFYGFDEVMLAEIYNVLKDEKLLFHSLLGEDYDQQYLDKFKNAKIIRPIEKTCDTPMMKFNNQLQTMRLDSNSSKNICRIENVDYNISNIEHGDRKYKILVYSCAEDNYKDIYKITNKYNRPYCKLHGYEWKFFKLNNFKENKIYSAKLEIAEQLIIDNLADHVYDYIMYLDCDAWFYNIDRKIEDLIWEAEGRPLVFGQNTYASIDSADRNAEYASSGVFMVKADKDGLDALYNWKNSEYPEAIRGFIKQFGDELNNKKVHADQILLDLAMFNADFRSKIAILPDWKINKRLIDKLLYTVHDDNYILHAPTDKGNFHELAIKFSPLPKYGIS